MSKIIEIKQHIALEKQKKKQAEHMSRVKPLLHFLQCSTCTMKCRRCGSTVDVSTDYAFPPTIASFAFCSDCRREYAEYQRTKFGQESEDIPWHNQHWKEMWNSWIEYQKALTKFLHSKEVRDLIEHFQE